MRLLLSICSCSFDESADLFKFRIQLDGYIIDVSFAAFHSPLLIARIIFSSLFFLIIWFGWVSANKKISYLKNSWLSIRKFEHFCIHITTDQKYHTRISNFHVVVTSKTFPLLSVHFLKLSYDIHSHRILIIHTAQTLTFPLENYSVFSSISFQITFFSHI